MGMVEFKSPEGTSRDTWRSRGKATDLASSPSMRDGV